MTDKKRNYQDWADWLSTAGSTFPIEWPEMNEECNGDVRSFLKSIHFHTPIDAIKSLFDVNSPPAIEWSEVIDLCEVTEAAYHLPPRFFGGEIPPNNLETGTLDEVLSNGIAKLARFLCLPGEQIAPLDQTDQVRYKTAFERGDFLDAVTSEEIKPIDLSSIRNLNLHFTTREVSTPTQNMGWTLWSDYSSLPTECTAMQFKIDGGLLAFCLLSPMGWSQLPTGPEEDQLTVPRFIIMPDVNQRDVSNVHRLYNKTGTNKGLMATLFGENINTLENDNYIVYPFAMEQAGESDIPTATNGMNLHSPLGNYTTRKIGNKQKTTVLRSQAMLDLYTFLFSRDWHKDYKYDDSQLLGGGTTPQELNFKDELKASIVYATIVNRMQTTIMLMHTQEFDNPWVEIQAVLNAKWNKIRGTPLHLAPVRSNRQTFLRCKILLRGIINTYFQGASDAKVDGNTRTVAGIYAALGLLPECTTNDLVHTYHKHGLVEQKICPNFIPEKCHSKYVFTLVKDPISASRLLQSYSKEIGKEKYAGQSRTFVDFFDQVVTDLIKTRSEAAINDMLLLPGLWYDPDVSPAQRRASDRIYITGGHPSKHQSFRNKLHNVYQHILTLAARETEIVPLRKELEAMNARINKGKTEKAREAIRQHIWSEIHKLNSYQPPTRYMLIAMMVDAIGHRIIIDNLEHPRIEPLSTMSAIEDGQYGFLQNLHSLIVNNGLYPTKFEEVCSKYPCNVRLLPPNMTPLEKKAYYNIEYRSSLPSPNRFTVCLCPQTNESQHYIQLTYFCSIVQNINRVFSRAT
jgi:hypothetical protein